MEKQDELEGRMKWASVAERVAALEAQIKAHDITLGLIAMMPWKDLDDPAAVLKHLKDKAAFADRERTRIAAMTGERVMSDNGRFDDYQDAADYFISTIDHLENCIKVMWIEMGKTTFHPDVDRQQSFLASHLDYAATIKHIAAMTGEQR